MKKSLLTAYALVFALIATAQPKVFFTKEITPESLVKIYKALGVEAKGRVAVKISTGEGGNTRSRPSYGRWSKRLTVPSWSAARHTVAPVRTRSATGRPYMSMVSTAFSRST